MPRGGFREKAGRKSAWTHVETQVIRVPKVFASQLIEIAKKLDSGEVIDSVTDSSKGVSDSVTESIKSVLSKWRSLSNLTTPKNTRWDKARQILDELEAVVQNETVSDSVTKSETHPGQLSLLNFREKPENEVVEDKISLEQVDSPTKEFSLPVSELGRRWKQTTPSITRAKRDKSHEGFIEYSKKKESALSNDFGWEYLPNVNRFRPVDISLEKLQELKDSYQVSPLPEGSERSEEG